MLRARPSAPRAIPICPHVPGSTSTWTSHARPRGACRGSTSARPPAAPERRAARLPLPGLRTWTLQGCTSAVPRAAHLDSAGLHERLPRGPHGHLQISRAKASATPGRVRRQRRHQPLQEPERGGHEVRRQLQPAVRSGAVARGACGRLLRAWQVVMSEAGLCCGGARKAKRGRLGQAGMLSARAAGGWPAVARPLSCRAVAGGAQGA